MLTDEDELTPMTSHERFAESLAALALDALDDDERAELEAHVASCDGCRAELAEMRRVTAGIGLTVDPVAPPASLRDRTLARATGATRPTVGPGGSSQARWPWLVAAASLAFAIAAGIYAFGMRSELAAVRALAAAATAQAERQRVELNELRRDAVGLQQAVAVITAPDVRLATLEGSGPAADTVVRAYWSPGAGLFLNASQLPVLEATEGFEVWLIPSGAGPISVGMLTVDPNRTAAHGIALPAGVTAATVAITIEAAGGSASGAPTSAPILAATLG